MKVVVKIHDIAEGGLREWRMSLSNNRRERNKLAVAFFEATEAALIRDAGIPSDSVPHKNWTPTIWTWESPTRGTYLVYFVRKKGWKLLRWLGFGTREVIVFGILPHLPRPDELASLARELNLRV
jgi:hypothetical protein